MKIKVVIPGLLFFSCMCYFSQAQIGGFVKNRASSATNHAQQQTGKEVDKKVNNAIDEGISNIFNKKKGDKDQPATNQTEPAKEQASEPANEPSSSSKSGSATNDAMSRAMMGRMGISMERPANIKNTYDYTGNLVMVVQSWDDGGDSDGKVLYTTHYTNDNKGYAMDFKSKDKGDSKMIFDNDNQIMIILGDDGKDKTGFVMGMAVNDSVSAPANTSTANNSAMGNTDYYTNFKKTGKTKTIAGYNTEEYVYEDTEGKASYWITNDLPAELWAKMFNANTIVSVYAGKPNGFIMELINEKKNSKEKSTMLVKEVNKNQPASISTMGYSFISYGGKPANAK